MEDKIEQIKQSIINIDKTLIKQSKDLEMHMFRTELAEKQIQINSERLEPVVKHVAYVNGGLKLIALVSVCVGIILGLSEIF